MVTGSTAEPLGDLATRPSDKRYLLPFSTGGCMPTLPRATHCDRIVIGGEATRCTDVPETGSAAGSGGRMRSGDAVMFAVACCKRNGEAVPPFGEVAPW
eukprot:CAMPEP_0179188966 /NCGR_PEP_ID=MMETSP0796-20121207/93798_1 /TAXON_ID=73915 /ORGANISM="Pyrodinium bahamense, Strain pbaha01" /LENGTH=98 /DNA_ID=CAMNT_0020893085 /DNA_START=291 /DNA_END=584 /DNA_ORIENTATION=-